MSMKEQIISYVLNRGISKLVNSVAMMALAHGMMRKDQAAGWESTTTEMAVAAATSALTWVWSWCQHRQHTSTVASLTATISNNGILNGDRPADASTPSNLNTKTVVPFILVGLLVGSMAYGDAQPATPTPGFGDTTLAAAKLVGAYIATNGSQSVSSGFSGFGSGKVVIAPVLSQSLTLASFGRVGANTLTFSVEHATSFQPNANRECLGLDANLHVWKNGKIGRILVFNFADCGLATGIDAPVEWFNGQHIRGSQLILQVGVFAHF